MKLSPLLHALSHYDSYLALAALEDGKSTKWMSSSAFLNGMLEEEIYMEQPQRFHHHWTGDKGVHLRKAIYGLNKLPAHGTYNSMESLLGLSFKRTTQMQVFMYAINKREMDLLSLFCMLNDITILGASLEAVKRLKADSLSDMKCLI